MARSLASKANVTAPDADFPFGRVKDNPGDGSGTPLNENTHGDFHQFFEKLLALKSIEANGLPDNEPNGYQYIEALVSLVNDAADTRVAKQQPAWVSFDTLTFQNSFTNSTAQYRIDETGMVFLRGQILAPSGGTGNAFTLPTLARPYLASAFILIQNSGSPNFGPRYCTLGTDGVLTFQDAGVSGIHPIFLDGVSFFSKVN